MNDPIHIISLGAGVQSSTMALMAAKGEITPMPIAAIFADTQAEPKSVYTWLDWLEKQLPFPVRRVTAGNLTNDCLNVRKSKKSGKWYVDNTIPAFGLYPNGDIGMFGRRCTYNHKIQPIVKEFRKILGLKSIKGSTIRIIQWIGISADEAHRMKDHRERWVKNYYPLVDQGITRRRCLEWMRNNTFPEPPRSACIYCPFHSDHEWSQLTQEDLAFAADFEKKLQEASRKSEVTNCVPYLHSTCKPIGTVDFTRNIPGYQQISLFGNECEGMCGV